MPLLWSDLFIQNNKLVQPPIRHGFVVKASKIRIKTKKIIFIIMSIEYCIFISLKKKKKKYISYLGCLVQRIKPKRYGVKFVLS